MAQTTPPAITASPAAPQRGDRTTFSTRVDAFITWLITAVGQFGAVATNVYNNAVDAFNNATAAAASAVAGALSATNAAASAAAASVTAGASAWVNGSTYALNVSAISQINFQTYRKITAASVSTIDPKNDPSNWAILQFYAYWAVVTGSYSAIVSDNLEVNTTSAVANITLPNTGLTAGVSRINFKDYAGTFQKNNLTVLRNGNNIEGIAEDMTVTNRGISFGLLYIDATKGWSIV